jgi:hypothetical protein
MDKLTTGYSPLENHPQHVQAIGMLSVEIGVAELLLGKLLGALLGLAHDLGEIIYMTPKSYTGRLEILENVAARCLQPKSEGLGRIGTLIKRTRTRIQYRNDMTHSGWGVLKSDRTVVTRRPFPFTENSKAEVVPVSELDDQIVKIRQLQQDILAEVQLVRVSRAEALALLQKPQIENLESPSSINDTG